jgi:hypothetical protein
MKIHLPTKFSSIWFETYLSGSHPDIQSLEKHATDFLKSIHNVTGSTSIVNHLCNNNFCGFVRSTEGETNNEYPQLELIVHPFKESIPGCLNDNEPIFGIKLSDDEHGNDVAQIIEIPNAKEEFSSLGNPTSTSNKNLIYTPTFQDLMGKFGEDNTQPLSNATELAPFDPTKTNTSESAKFPPTYTPRKFIPLTPVMINTILKHEPDEISGIINEIRLSAWASVDKLFDSEDPKIEYLGQVYKVVQALWVHGQQEFPTQDKNTIDKWKFIRCDPESTKETENKWAIEKAKLITGLSAKNHEMDDDDQSTKSDNSGGDKNDDEDSSTHGTHSRNQNKRTEKNVHWKPDVIDRLLDKTTKMTESANNLLAKMVNNEASSKGEGSSS